MNINGEDKKKLVKILDQHPRKADFFLLKPELEFLSLAKNHIGIVRPFFEFVVLKDESFSEFQEFLNRSMRIPRKLDSYLDVESRNNKENDLDPKIRIKAKELSSCVKIFYKDLIFLQNLMFVLLSESNEEPLQYLNLKIPEKTKEND